MHLESVPAVTFRTASGEDFGRINPKKYVPALILDNGTLITENVALLDWIASETPALQFPACWADARARGAGLYHDRDPPGV